MVDVEILVYTEIKELKRHIKIGLENGYNLQGSVTPGLNNNGNIIYVATLTRDTTPSQKLQDHINLVKNSDNVFTGRPR